MALLTLQIFATFSFLFVVFIRHYAEKKQILDHPNERSSHVMPTPRGGGLAIVVLVIGTAFLSRNETDMNQAAVYIGCGIVIAFLGWRD
ncbi:MAG TPA: glycosyl transferase, partial [Anaerolineae bacterium]|nr:glycosyl transferase [Anaerolineae bacterium]